MIDTGKRRSYPQLPITVWWALRKRFQKGMPSQVSPNYLVTVLGIQEGHARNLVPQLKAIGLISGDDERPTPLANRWRSDDEYASVCQEMLRSIYPAELTDAVSPDDPDRQAAQKWFMRETRVGEGAASRMAAFYLLLCTADPDAEATTSTRSATPERKAKSQGGTRSNGASDREASAVVPKATTVVQGPQGAPSIHIDVQIHIPNDAGPEQIDAIFASMAKHFGRG